MCPCASCAVACFFFFCCFLKRERVQESVNRQFTLFSKRMGVWLHGIGARGAISWSGIMYQEARRSIDNQY